jgi:hypothetical protein
MKRRAHAARAAPEFLLDTSEDRRTVPEYLFETSKDYRAQAESILETSEDLLRNIRPCGGGLGGLCRVLCRQFDHAEVRLGVEDRGLDEEADERLAAILLSQFCE